MKTEKEVMFALNELMGYCDNNNNEDEKNEIIDALNELIGYNKSNNSYQKIK